MPTPTPDWWHELSPYLDEALGLSDEERNRWLAALGETNPSLARRLEALLADHATLLREGFLERELGISVDQDTPAGRVVGAYTLRRLIGEGGMGSVWLADRTDGEIRQQVAIKLLGSAGVRPGWRERFVKERHLLSSLNHPSIVHVIDAGQTDDGRPYLVMEYVEGRPIDVYSRDIPVRDRLQLFVRVCEGVSHAHRSLIIHRDLKPSNILVDAAGRPKLLDFGIAKFLDDNAERTQTIERILTPAYASPEQFRGDAQTTATDIYSLGAVLYNLLTGRSPHERPASSSRAVNVPMDAAVVPPPTELNAALPSDVDYIVRKALRPEPEERYASVEAFANDVRALLESRPVEARSGDAWYRTRKFLRRHWVPVSAAALVLASLSVGLYVANRERAIASRRFDEVRQLANRFIALDAEIRNLPGATQARNHIVSESLEYLARLGPEASRDTDLATEIGNAYLQVAEVQGVPSAIGNLGRLTDAEASLRRADDVVDAVISVRPSNRTALLVSAQIAADLMATLDFQARSGEALTHADRAAARLDRLRSLGSLSAAEVDTATHIYANVATAYTNNNRFDDAVRYSQRAVDISRGVETARMRHASALGVLSLSLQGVGDLEGALTAVTQSRRVLETLAAAGGTSEQRNLVNAYTREGLILGESDGVSLSRPADALAVFQKAIDRAESLADANPGEYTSRSQLARAGLEMAAILRRSDPEGALRIYDRCLARLREIGSNSRSRLDQANLLAGSSYAARSLHRENDARRRIDEAFRILRDINEYPARTVELQSEAYYALRALADDYAETGQVDRSIETYQDLLTKMMAAKPDTENGLHEALVVSDTWSALTTLLQQAGRIDDARTLQVGRSELWERWNHKRPDNTFIRRQLEAATSR